MKRERHTEIDGKAIIIKLYITFVHVCLHVQHTKLVLVKTDVYNHANSIQTLDRFLASEFNSGQEQFQWL